MLLNNTKRYTLQQQNAIITSVAETLVQAGIECQIITDSGGRHSISIPTPNVSQGCVLVIIHSIFANYHYSGMKLCFACKPHSLKIRNNSMKLEWVNGLSAWVFDSVKIIKKIRALFLKMQAGMAAQDEEQRQEDAFKAEIQAVFPNLEITDVAPPHFTITTGNRVDMTLGTTEKGYVLRQIKLRGNSPHVSVENVLALTQMLTTLGNKG